MKPAAYSVSLLTYIITYKNAEDINMVIMKHGVTQKSDCPQLWTKVVETLPKKRKTCFVEQARFPISNSGILTPSQLFHVVTT